MSWQREWAQAWTAIGEHVDAVSRNLRSGGERRFTARADGYFYVAPKDPPATHALAEVMGELALRAVLADKLIDFGNPDTTVTDVALAYLKTPAGAEMMIRMLARPGGAARIVLPHRIDEATGADLDNWTRILGLLRRQDEVFYETDDELRDRVTAHLTAQRQGNDPF